MQADVIIIGGGVSGLAAAAALSANEVDWLLLEAADEPGGRIRTDSVDGALLDRGFQVLNTAYAALHRSIDMELLELQSFQLGARIMNSGRMSAFYDPQRLPGRALSSLGQSPANLGDYTALARLSLAGAGSEPASLDLPAMEVLPTLGFSERFIADFLRPFFSAVFLDPALSIPWRHLREMVLLFSQGLASLPAQGMQALPRLMAAGLDPQRIHCKRAVARLGRGELQLAGGATASCRLAILATDARAAASLTGLPGFPPMNGVRSFHYALGNPPTSDPIIYLPGGSEDGPLCSVAIPSNVQPGYAVGGRAQLVASSLHMAGRPGDFEEMVRRQLRSWFGGQVDDWELVGIYDIADALPAPTAMGSIPANDELLRERGLLLCGDYPGTPSINRAVASGRSAGNLAAMHIKLNKH